MPIQKLEVVLQSEDKTRFREASLFCKHCSSHSGSGRTLLRFGRQFCGTRFPFLFFLAQDPGAHWKHESVSLLACSWKTPLLLQLAHPPPSESPAFDATNWASAGWDPGWELAAVLH